MPVSSLIKIRQQTYHTKDSELLQEAAGKIICILFPSAVLVAHLSPKGETISLHYTDTEEPAAEWDEYFMEKALANELMIRHRSAKRHVFIHTEKQMLIPDTVHQQDTDGLLLGDIFHIHADEQVRSLPLKADKAHLVFSCPNAAVEIAERYIGTSDLRPLNVCQYYAVEKGWIPKMNTLLTDTTAYATLRDNGKLLWHQAIPYNTPMDICYQLAQICREWNFSPAETELSYTASFPGAAGIMHVIEAFFPNIQQIKKEVDAPEWLPVLSLLQQLSECVS